MPRLIRLDATGPIKIEPRDFPRDEQGALKAIWICACGLSRSMPYCDKSHKQCATTERPGCLHTYDADRKHIISTTPEA